MMGANLIIQASTSFIIATATMLYKYLQFVAYTQNLQIDMLAVLHVFLAILSGI